MLEVLVLGVRMSEINPVGNISIIPSKRNINFKAAGIIPADNDYDVFIKKQQKEQKNRAFGACRRLFDGNGYVDYRQPFYLDSVLC